MTPAQIVSIIVATIVAGFVVVFTINENKPVPVVVNNNESDTTENERIVSNETFSIQDIIKSVTK